MSPETRTQLLILQPTPFCNLSCRYCYLSPDARAERSRMSLETVRRSAELALEVGGFSRFLVLWHLGEPLVVEPGWYQKAHRLLERTLGATRIRFEYQTNATLLTSSWARFFQADPRISVGISVDGPAAIHDANRKTRRKTGTHARVMSGIQSLREADVSFNCIAVVTDLALGEPDAFYEFFAELRPVSLGLSPEEVDGFNPTSSLCGEAQEARYRAFLRRLVDLWLQDNRPFQIRELRRMETLLRLAHLGEVPIYFENQQTTPGAILSFDWKGNVHTFSPELLGSDIPGVGPFLGNVHTHTWRQIQASEPFNFLKGEIDLGVARCRRECGHFFACQGGAPANKWFELKSFGAAETRYCRLTAKSAFDTFLDAAQSHFQPNP